MKIRTYDEIFSALLAALPSSEEIKALSDDEMTSLRGIGNEIDNVFYIAMQRRLADEERKAI